MTKPGDWRALSKITKHTWRGGLNACYWSMSADGQTKVTQWFSTDEVEMPDPGSTTAHLYFSVHPTIQAGSSNQRASRATVAAINCVFADFDAKDEVKFREYSPFLPDDYDELKPADQRVAVKSAQEKAMMLDLPTYKARALAKVDKCPLVPTWVIDTGGGYQCYWFIAETVPLNDDNRERIEALQAEWVQVIGADPGAKDLARVLRCPDSLNMKEYFAPDYPVVTVVEYDASRLYDLEAFEEITGIDEVWQAAKKAKPQPREGTDLVISKFNETVKIGDLLAKNGYQLGRQFQRMERYARPGRDKHQTSVVVWLEENRSFHHSSSDALNCNGHSRDAFDVFTTLYHNGDASDAYKAAKKELGLWEEKVEVTVKGLKKKPEPKQAHGSEEESSTGNDDASILLEWPVHDHGNASVVNALHPEAFAFNDALGWMANVGTYYDTENAERTVNRAITETLIRRRMAAVEAEREDIVKGTVPNASRKNAVKDMLKDLVVVRLGEFDNDPNVLNCANGVIDLRTGQLVAHGPSNRFTYCVPTPYIPTAKSELWCRFLAESVGDYNEIDDWLQMSVGYSITGLTREEILYYIEGPTRSGKGTFEHTKLTLLGSPLARGVDFNTFTSKRDGDSQNFDLAPLRAARLISASESGRYSALNEAVVKNITGNDPITAAFKHRDQFTYTPQFKIWLSSNYPVKGDVDDDAFWGRIRVIRFPNSHLGHEDKTLKWRMSSAEVLPGILAWAVEGARRWYASPQGLITPKAVMVATQKHRDELDHVQQWLDECVELSFGEVTANTTLYLSYQNWCEDNGHTQKKAVAFGRGLVAKGFEPAAKKIAGKVHRGYRGLRLQNETEISNLEIG